MESPKESQNFVPESQNYIKPQASLRCPTCLWTWQPGGLTLGGHLAQETNSLCRDAYKLDKKVVKCQKCRTCSWTGKSLASHLASETNRVCRRFYMREREKKKTHPSALKADILFLKRDGSIFRQSSNQGLWQPVGRSGGSECDCRSCSGRRLAEKSFVVSP